MDRIGVAEPERLFPGQLACPDAPVWRLSDDDVDAALRSLDGDEARLVARRVELLNEAVSRGLPERRTQALTPQRWLRDAHLLSSREATRRLREASDLTSRPLVLTALAAAEVTAEQAAVVCRVLTSLQLTPGVTAAQQEEATCFLLGQCAVLDPTQLARAGSQLVERLSTQPSVDDAADAEAIARAERRAETAAQLAEQNVLHLRRLADGSISGRFRLTPLAAAGVGGWLRQADAKYPGEGELADSRELAVRRGDHLAATLGAAALTGVGDAPPVDVRVVATMTLEALDQALAGAVLDSGGTLSGAEARRLACSAGLLPAVLGGESEVLDLGRTRRMFTPAQRTALTVRDRGCVAPGCDRPPAACQAHHQVEWTDDGPTDLANGALLCLFHHQQVHRQGWRVVLAPNGFPALVPPATIDPERRPRQHHRYALDHLVRRRC